MATTLKDVRNALNDLVNDLGDFDADKFRANFAPLCEGFINLRLTAHDTRDCSKYFTDNECNALAAAIDYFLSCSGVNFDDNVDKQDDAITLAIGYAVATIRTSDYIFFPDCDDYRAVGEKFFYDYECNWAQCQFHGLEDLLDTYFDFKQYGKEIVKAKFGKFTNFGFFSPDENA